MKNILDIIYIKAVKTAYKKIMIIAFSFLIIVFSVIIIQMAISSSLSKPVSSLIAYWKFDEKTGTTASDSSGNSNDGLISGATWTAGKIGNALRGHS